MRIGFGCDHAAAELKEELLHYMEEKGHECVDYGISPGEKADYPVQGRKVAEAITAGEVEKGVLICGTGVGISLAANKVAGYPRGSVQRAVHGPSVGTAQQRQHHRHGRQGRGAGAGEDDSGRVLRSQV